ncbi:MAG: cell division protein ZapA [Lachnospiraceae bacterium]|nr:cell division protein ZapA [Lachnospiraceae bacterium]
MAEKNDTNVVIGGKVFTLSGSESEEYLQRVAAYLNAKNSECERSENFRRLSREMQQLMLQINVVDDFFKLRETVKSLQDELKTKDDELTDLRKKLAGAQMKLEESLKRFRNIENKKQANNPAVRNG